MQLNKLTKEESKVIDILKCIAILSVISAHVIQYSEVNLIAKIASIFWGKFSCIGVVIFFIIGGFLYSRNDGDDAIFWKYGQYLVECIQSVLHRCGIDH